MIDTLATVICPEDQIPTAQAVCPDAAGMFTAMFTDDQGAIYGVSTGGIFNETLTALSQAQIPGLLFRFPDGQLQGLTKYPPEPELEEEAVDAEVVEVTQDAELAEGA
jgi:hypothetical protein